MGLCDYTTYSFIKRNARVSDNKIALVLGNQRITHSEFLEKVDRLSCGLSGAGVEKGDCICLVGQNSPEYFYLYGAAAKIGAIILPINWRLDPDKIKYIISDGTSKIFFVSPEFQDMITLLISKLGFVKKTYALGHDQGFFEDFNDLMDSKGICPEVDVHFEDDYVII